VASAAASSVQPSAARLLVHAARARASRRRVPRAAAHERPLLQRCAYAIGCSHATGPVGVATRARARLADSTVLAFGRTLRVRTGAVRLCGSGSAGMVAAHQCTHSALLRSTLRIGHHREQTTRVRRRPRHRRGVLQRPVANKQTNERANQQINTYTKRRGTEQTASQTHTSIEWLGKAAVRRLRYARHGTLASH
jgi:hypothetical protein